MNKTNVLLEDYPNSRDFWANAKKGLLDIDSFMLAFKADLDKKFNELELSWDDMFGSNDKLKGKWSYGKIKQLLDKYPNDWNVKALLKFWVLQFNDNAKTVREINREEQRKQKEIERAEQEKRRQEEKAAEEKILAETTAFIDKFKPMFEDELKKFLAENKPRLDELEEKFNKLYSKPIGDGYNKVQFIYCPEEDITCGSRTYRRGERYRVSDYPVDLSKFILDVKPQRSFGRRAAYRVFCSVYIGSCRVGATSSEICVPRIYLHGEINIDLNDEQATIDNLINDYKYKINKEIDQLFLEVDLAQSAADKAIEQDTIEKQIKLEKEAAYAAEISRLNDIAKNTVGKCPEELLTWIEDKLQQTNAESRKEYRNWSNTHDGSAELRSMMVEKSGAEEIYNVLNCSWRLLDNDKIIIDSGDDLTKEEKLDNIVSLLYKYKDTYVLELNNNDLEEAINNNRPGRLSTMQMNKYRDELKRITYCMVQIYETGMFHIYNVRAKDVNNVLARIRRLDYIESVSSSPSGKYDFNNMYALGGIPQQYHTITGRIKL